MLCRGVQRFSCLGKTKKKMALLWLMLIGSGFSPRQLHHVPQRNRDCSFRIDLVCFSLIAQNWNLHCNTESLDCHDCSQCAQFPPPSPPPPSLPPLPPCSQCSDECVSVDTPGKLLQNRAGNQVCEDGGTGSVSPAVCALGTDCADCGFRGFHCPPPPSPPTPPPPFPSPSPPSPESSFLWSTEFYILLSVGGVVVVGAWLVIIFNDPKRSEAFLRFLKLLLNRKEEKPSVDADTLKAVIDLSQR